MSLPLTSKLPPNCGLVSSDKFSNSLPVAWVTEAKDKVPLPLVFKNWPLEPSAVGWDKPSRITLPEPLGVIDMLPLDTDTIELPLTSKFPPSCGVVSPTISDKPPAAVDIFPNDIFFNEPASASWISKKSFVVSKPEVSCLSCYNICI